MFEELADRYDAWYDSAHGRLLFDLELACLRPLVPPGPGPRLEVGAGSGRFAAALGLEVGLDPARAPLRLATGRAVAVVQGAGERLPFGDRTFGAVVLVVTLCFADDPAALLGEARRVLAPTGRLVAGVAPSTAPGAAATRRRGAPATPSTEAPGSSPWPSTVACSPAPGSRSPGPAPPSPRPRATTQAKRTHKTVWCPAPGSSPFRRGRSHRSEGQGPVTRDGGGRRRASTPEYLDM